MAISITVLFGGALVFWTLMCFRDNRLSISCDGITFLLIRPQGTIRWCDIDDLKTETFNKSSALKIVLKSDGGPSQPVVVEIDGINVPAAELADLANRQWRAHVASDSTPPVAGSSPALIGGFV